jgi:hypothetical protein
MGIVNAGIHRVALFAVAPGAIRAIAYESSVFGLTLHS